MQTVLHDVFTTVTTTSFADCLVTVVNRGEDADTTGRLSVCWLARYAAGPEALDWDEPPNSFREFVGAGLNPRLDKTAAFQFQPWLAVDIP